MTVAAASLSRSPANATPAVPVPFSLAARVVDRGVRPLRAPNTRELEEQELLCKFIENSLKEEYVGELADCQAELSRLKALDHHNKALMETATP